MRAEAPLIYFHQRDNLFTTVKQSKNKFFICDLDKPACLYFIINLKLNFVSRKRPTKKTKRRKPEVLDSERKCCELIGQK